MRESRVSSLDGNTFIVSDTRGDVESSPSTPDGLFVGDTRYLSRWVLTINGDRLSSLSVDDLQYFEAGFFLAPGSPTHYIDANLSVIRRRSVGVDLTESLTLLNFGGKTLDFAVRLEAAADFADIFEIKDDVRDKMGDYYTEVTRDGLRLGYRRQLFQRETSITSSEPAAFDEHGLRFDLRLESGQEWSTTINLDLRVVGPGGRDLREAIRAESPRPGNLAEDLRAWTARAPTLNCESSPLANAYRRSLVDLAALRFSALSLGGAPIPAAGLPWFMTLFGRDSLLTCLQTLPFTPEMAPPTLRVLASLQGARIDDTLDEDPGRIMHELRYGESAAFEEQPHSPYYGSADASPLFVILLDEYERWTGDVRLARELASEARGALTWMDEYANLMNDGYVWYERRNLLHGLENQCWKDSWDGIAYRDGRLPAFPRATCEVQGYAYDAKVRAARLARECWDDPDYADRLEREAAALKERFNRDFWVSDGEYYAIALDPDGRQVDSLSSNMGHLLWSGIVPPERAAKLVEHLMGPRLFSGWGIRTLATGQPRFNPVGYHNGTVWPFDNSFIAWGLRRYGFDEAAGQIARGIIDAAGYFDGRLPEAFAGFPREATRYPVQYPTACSPQAWSSGALLLLIRVLLGLEAHEGHLVVNPALPSNFGSLELLDIPGRWGRMDAFARSRS